MDIPEFEEIKHELIEIRNLISDKNKSKQIDDRFLAEWYNDEDCWRLKGGPSFSTYRSNRFIQCKGGIPDAKVGGRKVWSRESVMEWVKLTDDELPAYHQRYRTGATKR